ncbi:MAG: T9SS type A sorting domain-containing protein [Saprospiraceae bacterium]
MKFLRSLPVLIFTVYFSLQLNACLAQDTITLQTLTWDSTSRSYWYNFPDIPSNEIERINMIYNMRCHNAAVGNGSVGCYEWDYSCNTFITDTFRLDSIGASQKKYVIPNFNSGEYYYSNTPTYECLGFKQKKVNFTNITNEINATVGKAQNKFVLGGNNGRKFLLYTAGELAAAGLKVGKIQGMKFSTDAEGGNIPFLRIKIKATKISQVDASGLDFENINEVYFSNTTFNANQLQSVIFYNPFQWDGTSNILIELSYNSSPNNKSVELKASDEQLKSFGSTGSNYSLFQNGGKGFDVDNQKLKQIKNEISISFWSYGDASILPTNTVIFEGVDSSNQRQVNVHLPWENSSIYWDCGNDGTGYDRIEKAANTKDYEGQWVNWTFTKNCISGIMNIYKNGSLWQTGSSKKRTINLDKLMIASNIDNQLSYFGKISHFAIWNKELDSTTIKQWILQPGNINHPQYASLIYYFPMNKNQQGTIEDLSTNPKSIETTEFINWFEEKGRNMIGAFENYSTRPITTFIQGTLNGLNVEDIQTVEEVQTIRIAVKEYEILNGSAALKQTYQVYPAGEFLITNEDGGFVDVKTIPHDGIFVLEDLNYQLYSPSKFELLSLVTPYGNGLDLTKDGKTFIFDVTDYAPILRGNKKLSIELGGEYQEELNIKFQYIKGKAAREVKDIINVYRFQRQGFTSILNGTSLEQRNLTLRSDANSYKIRTTVTGHEQNGEFTNRSHFIKVEGNKLIKKFDFNVWKECADNPIYPQGGTWIFDRAGWCPGAPSEIHSFDISSLADPGSKVKIDYGLNGLNLDQANYLISCQLVSYGAPNYSVDAGIEAIVRPNNSRVEFERFNPSCSRPVIQVKNYGSNDINSILVKYKVIGGGELQFNWTGILKPLEITQITLPIDQMSFWGILTPTDNNFIAEITEVNNQKDENVRNNLSVSKFNVVRSFDFDPVFEIRTNNVAGDNSFRVKDMNGNIIIEKNNIAANTTIQENLAFANGCYTLEVDDRANDGLSFWFYPNFGSGSIAFKKRINTTLAPIQLLKADFGSKLQYDFIINKTNAVQDLKSNLIWNITPNPASDYFQLVIQSSDHSEIRFQLLNSIGYTVLEKKFKPKGTSIDEKIDIGKLQSGIYWIQIFQNNRKTSKKLIVE